jgi:ribosome-associated protein
MSTDLIVTDAIVIPGDELSVIAVRSSGPGGQNVNKVATKVELRFDLANTAALPDAVKARLLAACRGRLDAEGRVIITSEATRNRIRNLTDARQKLASLIRRARRAPPRSAASKKSGAARA